MKVLIILAAIFAICQAWIAVIPSDNNKSSDCFTTHKNIGALRLNQRKRIEGMCAEAQCQENGQIQMTGCAPVNVAPPCVVLDGDLSKPFPDCCFEIKCD